MKLKIGNKLLSIRDERRLSQAEMADLLGVPTTTYARIERNESPVEIERVTDFSDKLQVPIQELLPETISITNNNQNWGQGGGIIFGNQYFYISKEETTEIMMQENAALRKKVSDLEKKISDKK
ncbi:MAG: XRE family transcriptional regulator [Bacteroidetes bacterium]|nr:MAG: XRE family transcriptional regulator [Bacteroidota bacterium]